ncbi:MAG: ABC transporter ATP-binding protein [Candidatus Coatesbacteria bacterium]
MIRIEGLTKKYGALTAVDGLSLQVRRGEVYGFLGPNGAGKTTAIRIITGLLKPTAGTIVVAGHDIAKEPEAAKRSLGYIADEPRPYDKLTGREFLLTIGALYGLPEAKRRARADELMEFFGLEAWADELSESYSHGMRQKLMIASALLHEPEVIVADEPLVGLDPASARKLRELFRSLATQGKTVLLATHILEIAERLCDRVGIMGKGRLLEEGSVGELRDRLKRPGQNLEEIFLELTGGPAPEQPEGAP